MVYLRQKICYNAWSTLHFIDTNNIVQFLGVYFNSQKNNLVRGKSMSCNLAHFVAYIWVIFCIALSCPENGFSIHPYIDAYLD